MDSDGLVAHADLILDKRDGEGVAALLAGLLIEQWITAGYSVLVIDMEGDHIRLPDGHVVATARNLEEFLRLLGEVDGGVIEHSCSPVGASAKNWPAATPLKAEAIRNLGANCGKPAAADPDNSAE